MASMRPSHDRAFSEKGVIMERGVMTCSKHETELIVMDGKITCAKCAAERLIKESALSLREGK